MSWFPTSAKTNTNIEEAIQSTAESILKNTDALEYKKVGGGFKAKNTTASTSSGCC